MGIKTYDISEFHDQILDLKKLHYQTEAHQNILAFMINKGMVSGEGYEKCWSEYIESYVQYEEYKKYFINNFIIPKYGAFVGDWKIDFKEEVINIYDKV